MDEVPNRDEAPSGWLPAAAYAALFQQSFDDGGLVLAIEQVTDTLGGLTVEPTLRESLFRMERFIEALRTADGRTATRQPDRTSQSPSGPTGLDPGPSSRDHHSASVGEPETWAFDLAVDVCVDKWQEHVAELLRQAILDALDLDILDPNDPGDTGSGFPEDDCSLIAAAATALSEVEHDGKEALRDLVTRLAIGAGLGEIAARIAAAFAVRVAGDTSAVPHLVRGLRVLGVVVCIGTRSLATCQSLAALAKDAAEHVVKDRLEALTDSLMVPTANPGAGADPADHDNGDGAKSAEDRCPSRHGRRLPGGYV